MKLLKNLEENIDDNIIENLYLNNLIFIRDSTRRAGVWKSQKRNI